MKGYASSWSIVLSYLCLKPLKFYSILSWVVRSEKYLLLTRQTMPFWPLGMPSLCCSFSKLLNVSSTAWDIFCRVRGVRGGILVSMATTSPGPSNINITQSAKYIALRCLLLMLFSTPSINYLTDLLTYATSHCKPLLFRFPCNVLTFNL